jgi:2-methylcitrate dehydratase PrpD
MDGHQLAARFISNVHWEELSSAVQWKARMCLVDNLGAMLAGTLTRVSRISADYAAETWPGDQSTIFRYEPELGLHTRRANMAGAAFANGNANNGIDVDDSTRYAYGHAGAQLFPTVLAVAEGFGKSGAELLTALVVGYEVAHRVGRCWHASRDVYQACGSWGCVACAAAASHLMGLTAEQSWHALGIAEYHAGNLPMMRDIDHPAMVKHGTGWAAMSGVVAAGLAARGFTGIPSLLSFEEYQHWVCDIGENYLIVDGVAWKETRYACCGWAHAGVEGARRLVQEHGIALDDIAEILVEGCHGTASLYNIPPTTTEEAQFSQSWPLAAMLVDGEIGPDQTLEARLQDPQILALANKVRVVETPHLEHLSYLFSQGDPAGRFASQVTITLQDGREFHSGLVDGGLRFPQPGWDEERMSDKFRWLAGFVLAESGLDQLLDTLWHFERIQDVGQWIPALVPGKIPHTTVVDSFHQVGEIQ